MKLLYLMILYLVGALTGAIAFITDDTLTKQAMDVAEKNCEDNSGLSHVDHINAYRYITKFNAVCNNKAIFHLEVTQ